MIYFEEQFPGWLSGVNFKKAVTMGSTLSVTGNVTNSGNLTVSGAITAAAVYATSALGIINSPIFSHSPVAVNATATLTAAQVGSGYITSTSAAAVTMTLPTGSLLGPVLAASAGTVFDLWIDNTAGANTVTLAVATNGILNANAAANGASFGLLTVPSGVTGQARFTLAFSSPTAYSFARTA